MKCCSIFVNALTLFVTVALRCDSYMFVGENPPLIVDWCPKSGCTVVWTTLYRNYGLLDEVLSRTDLGDHVQSRIHRYRECVYTPAHPLSLSKLEDPKYYKIKFVRNSFKRAVSSYLNQCYETNASFEEFLIHLKENTLAEICSDSQALIDARAHAQLQYKATDHYMNQIINIEYCEQQLIIVNQLLGLHLDIQSETSAHHINYTAPFEAYVGNVVYREKRQNFPPYYCFYSSKTLQLVQEIYQQDIEAYHFEVPQEVLDFIDKCEGCGR